MERKKAKADPLVKRSGASCKGPVTSLRAKAKKASENVQKWIYWCANMNREEEVTFKEMFR